VRVSRSVWIETSSTCPAIVPFPAVPAVQIPSPVRIALVEVLCGVGGTHSLAPFRARLSFLFFTFFGLGGFFSSVFFF